MVTILLVALAVLALGVVIWRMTKNTAPPGNQPNTGQPWTPRPNKPPADNRPKPPEVDKDL